jgi:lysosomal acid lipase/cholesteryl ester hydrolase
MAIRHGYAAETHTVLTEDGYLLTMHRIPCGKTGCAARGGRGRGQPVYLQHGLLSSSADWMLSGPGKALAYVLADAGYDVWMGNIRGNTYSRRHVTYNNEDEEFWDFSWDEMAVHDVPAQIDYIYSIKADGANTTLNDLIYVGHSMGTTMLFAMLSERPEYDQKIRAAIALAPVGYMKHVKSPLRLLAPYSKDIQMIIRFFGANEFFPQNKIIKFLSKYGCELTEAERFICENSVFVISGFDKAQFNETLMPVIFGHTPAGTSTKTVVHYAQEIDNHGKFQKYDYGKERNMEKYGQDYPPVYNVTGITTPIALFYTTNDWLAGPSDVAVLFDDLANSAIGMYKIANDEFNHVDFLWGIDAPTLVNAPVMKLMERYRTD